MFFIWIFFIFAAGGAVQAVMGFGSGVVAMALLSFLLTEVTQAASIVMAATTAGVIYLLIRYRKHARVKMLFLPWLAFFLIMPASALLSVRIGAAAFGWLGILLLVFGIFYFFFESKAKISSAWPGAVSAGLLTGVINGMFSMGGPPIALYLLSATESKEEYIATIQVFFLISNLYALVVRGMAGLVTVSMVPAMVVGAAGVLLGMFFGNRLFHKLHGKTFRRFVYTFIAVTGAWLAVKAWLL